MLRSHRLSLWPQALIALAAAGVSGVAVSEPRAASVLAAACGLGVCVAIIARFGLGCAIGLLLLGAVDALPGPDLGRVIFPSVTGCDLMVFLLIGVLAYENRRNSWLILAHTSWGRAAAGWSATFLVYWLFTLGRTWLTGDVVLVHSIVFARDLLYFALLVPLLLGALQRRSLRLVVLSTIAGGAVVAGLSETAVAISGRSVPLLVHARTVAEANGITRLYTSATDLLAAGLPLGLGAVLLGRERVIRAAGAVIVVVSLATLLTALTRAVYLGETVGVAAGLAVWLLGTKTAALTARRRLMAVVAVCMASAGLLVVYSPAIENSTAVNGVSQRVSSLVAVFGQSTSTDAAVNARTTDYAYLQQLLSGHWATGLGFLDARDHYQAGLLLGSIRNPDVGAFNVIETMGLLGALLYAIPLLVVLGALLFQRVSQAHADARDWLRFGVFGWAVAALVTAPTLLWLFEPTEVTASAFMVALGGFVLAHHEPVA